MKLRRAHYAQILSLINDWRDSDRGKWYYGNREQFLKRMEDLEQWAREQFDKATK